MTIQFLSPNLRFNILGSNHVLPSGSAISNVDILKNFPRTATKPLSFQQKMAQMITKETGFEKRYWVHKPWQSLDDATENAETLAIKALSSILESKPTIDAFIMGSTTNTRYSGSQASSVLGQFNYIAPAYDFKAGCSTSLASLNFAYGLMHLGYKNTLICCAETMSKIIDPTNEKTWLGVADGAAALLLEANQQGQFCVEKTFFSTDGQYVDAFTTKGTLPPTPTTLEQDGYFLQGDEALLKDLAVEKYTAMLDQLFSEVDKAEISWIIPHQVNLNLTKMLIEKYQLQHCQLLWDAKQIGNIGGASILYTLTNALKNNTFNKDGKILMMSVGGGLSFAMQVLSYKA